ncbi:PfkB family carbohydrate kinase [Actinoplanes sp. TRM 88003]|uniref:PfkB family carbohydrate kinase n=1 Tax=Paractinoplanes aksuensis TaxID=2939490 RepID=A0ABT1DNA5_9ACTN|nr:PfkB family carbohydrate kinase [Actinoplanes aksuensis]MCO8271241.1 PfkB family carbohydrate kinase [Actinoplanes aksuensis]
MILCVGLATVDLVYRVDRIPGADEKAQATGFEVAAGGPAANAAVTAAALGAPVTLVTAIGSHPLGALIRSDLEAHGVRVIDAAHDSAGPPPVSSIVVAGRDRTIISRNAGNLRLAVPPDGLPEADLTLVDGHHPVLAVAAAKAARRLVVDAGTWRPVFADILPHAEVVACSAAFRHPAGAVDAPHVVVTHGPEPVTWVSGGVTRLIAVPPVEAVETSGAGDAFHGALAHALHEAATMDAALTEAIRVAGVRVAHPGARDWLSSL